MSKEENRHRQGEGSDEDDEEFEFGNYAKKQEDSKAKEVTNKPYDAAVDLTNDSDAHGSQATPEDTPRDDEEDDDDDEGASEGNNSTSDAKQMKPKKEQDKKKVEVDSDKSEEETSGEAEESDEEPSRVSRGAAPAPQQASLQGVSGQGGESSNASNLKKNTKLYNPDDWAHLKVSSEIQGLFDHIGRHKPQNIELETKLRPFFPDLIPAVGEIDAFLKIPPPDEKKDGLGLTVLDEPALDQSDPTVLDMKIRRDTRKAGLEPIVVRGIDHADKNPQKITTWINNVEGVHRGNPPPTVTYSKPMPDIESLMQVWPSEFEEILKSTPLPAADLNMDIAQYSKVICSLLDIPTHDRTTDSLHLLFTLYSEFKSNAHFSQT